MPYSKKRPFRFIFSGTSDGPANMAVDEAVLTEIKEKRSTPLLRIYRWNPPTISIGYFQSIEDIDHQGCTKDGIGVVRRLTGGRAVLHSEELTYSILFTEEDFAPFNKKDIFLSIARCLVDALGYLGIDSRIAWKTRGSLQTANCFASPAQYEIESLKAGKLIGSAQVIKDGVVLQHGAIPITTSYTGIAKYLRCATDSGKHTTSLNQVSNDIICEERLLAALKGGFSRHINLTDGAFTDSESSLFKELALNKYSQQWWTFRR